MSVFLLSLGKDRLEADGYRFNYAVEKVERGQKSWIHGMTKTSPEQGAFNTTRLRSWVFDYDESILPEMTFSTTSTSKYSGCRKQFSGTGS